MREYIKRLLLAITLTVILTILILGGMQSIANAEVAYSKLNWEFPADGTISDIYGSRNGSHKGIDIASEIGTPIHAVDQGTVSKSYYSTTYGHVIFIHHDTGYETVYAHLQSRDVNKGQNVKKGETIGRMGTTGKSSGPHLHFEIHKNKWTVSKKNSIDPFVIFGRGNIGQTVTAGDKNIEPVLEVAKGIHESSILYTVEVGDTLWEIAEKYNTDIEIIKEMNQLSNEIIMPGQQLIIK